jgi:hypothetical protein
MRRLMMNDAEVKNLEVIAKGIDQHNRNCKRGPAVEVRMNPFEVERLDWDEVKGIPIVADPEIGTGCFRVVCAGERNNAEEAEATEAVTADREVEVAETADKPLVAPAVV